MKLTEAKLKQMILEAIKNKRMQDFGIPTPDENLKSKLGDENFDKIQSLDKNQADVMKQTFDPNYPRDLKQQTFEDLVKPFGFKRASGKDLGFDELFIGKYTGPYRIKFYDAYHHSSTFSDRVYVKYGVTSGPPFPNEFYLEYILEVWDQSKGDNTFKKKGYIKIPDMFEIDLRDPEDDKTAESLIINKEKENILPALKKFVDK